MAEYDFLTDTTGMYHRYNAFTILLGIPVPKIITSLKYTTIMNVLDYKAIGFKIIPFF